MNNGSSITKWSESPVESWNKFVRSFQSGPAAISRQLSLKGVNKQDFLQVFQGSGIGKIEDNLTSANPLSYIFRRMSIVSHPEIA